MAYKPWEEYGVMTKKTKYWFCLVKVIFLYEMYLRGYIIEFKEETMESEVFNSVGSL